MQLLQKYLEVTGIQDGQGIEKRPTMYVASMDIKTALVLGWENKTPTDGSRWGIF